MEMSLWVGMINFVKQGYGTNGSKDRPDESKHYIKL